MFHEFFTLPVLVELVGVMLAAFLAFLASHYVLTPKRCQKQKEACKEYIDKRITGVYTKIRETKEEVDKNISERKAAFDQLEKRHEKLVERIDTVYARNDVVIPRLDDIAREVRFIKEELMKFLRANGHGGNTDGSTGS